MKIIKSITAVAFAVALFVTPSFAADTPAPCCAKAKEAKKECTHGECCAQAAKDKTVCEKCGGKKEEKKSS